MKRRIILFALIVVLAACGSNKPDHKAVEGERLYLESFNAPGEWEEGQFPANADAPTSTLSITEGHYQIDHHSANSSSFIWGAGGTSAQDVIITVSTQQLSGDKDNLYGVACRLTADDSGDTTGYMLLISGDGNFGIAKLSHRNLDFIRHWKQSSAIKQGRAKNTIHAVCIGNYFALYANGKFLGDVKDTTYQQAGQVGLVAGANQRKTATITFDDLAVYQGTLGD